MSAADRALLVSAAEAAGAVARRMQARPLRQWDKPGQGPVSEADLAVNEALKSALLPARPGYGWLSEEDPESIGGAERLSAERVFLVDPIDGTRAYIAGEAAYAISVAVAERGRVIAAAVHLPARGETYAAHAGGGAWLGEAPLAHSGRAKAAGAEVLMAKTFLAPEHWPGGPPQLVRRFRSSLAWRLCLVAAGAFDAVLTFRAAWEWDIAAGCLIAEEAGCRVTDDAGRPLAFNAAPPKAPGMVAAPPRLHAELMALRNPA